MRFCGFMVWYVFLFSRPRGLRIPSFCKQIPLSPFIKGGRLIPHFPLLIKRGLGGDLKTNKRVIKSPTLTKPHLALQYISLINVGASADCFVTRNDNVPARGIKFLSSFVKEDAGREGGFKKPL